MINIKIALAITSDSGEAVYSDNQHTVWESSSTIKIPILLLALKKMAAESAELDSRLIRQPHHATKGSGILNWTSLSSFSLKDLISTTLIYSDCLATNILIDYAGGQEAVNSWLAGKGFATRLLMPYLVFDGQETAMPAVGRTTAAEMLALYALLDTAECGAPFRRLINQASSHVNESWLELSLPKPQDDLRHKTGSMIDCGPHGDTVYNAAGTFSRKGKRYYFCLLSFGRLRQGAKHIEPREMSRLAAGRLAKAVEMHC